MKITLHLNWTSKQTLPKKAFKSDAYLSLVQDYADRISRSFSCEIKVGPIEEKSPGAVLWVCEREKGGKILSSEDLAAQLDDVKNSGLKELVVLIGGSDGFTEDELRGLQPGLRWSFGKMTLPHELAAVVATEQVYRAITILENHPYHLGH